MKSGSINDFIDQLNIFLPRDCEIKVNGGYNDNVTIYDKQINKAWTVSVNSLHGLHYPRIVDDLIRQIYSERAKRMFNDGTSRDDVNEARIVQLESQLVMMERRVGELQAQINDLVSQLKVSMFS
jgi:hypothetical protein